MVFYFTSNSVSEPAFIYVGKDKVENEDLIKFGWDEDVWYYPYTPYFDHYQMRNSAFLACIQGKVMPNSGYTRLAVIDGSRLQFHADNLSSAHVYLRLKSGQAWTSIAQTLLEDCAQLTKANSIEGNKKDNVTVIYTPWSNLKKDASMATGQVSFHDPKLTKKILVPVRKNAIINRLNKTRVEKFPDLLAEREQDQKQKRKVERLMMEEKKAQERQEKKEREEKRWQKEHAYDDILNEDNMISNQDRGADFWEEDFM